MNACKLHEDACMHGKTRSGRMQVKRVLRGNLPGFDNEISFQQAGFCKHASCPPCVLTDIPQRT